MQLFSTPYPLPDAVLRNTFQTLPHFLPRGSRIVLYPANQVTEALICQEVLSLWHVLGTMANGKKSHPFIKPTLSLEELKGIKADAILAVDPCFPCEPSPEAQEIGSILNVPVYNLCSGYDRKNYRAKLTRALGPLASVEGFGVTDVEVRLPKWGLGDMLCALTAARALARLHPGLRVHFNRIPKVVNAYGDDLVTPGVGYSLDIGHPDSPFFFWEQGQWVTSNYVDNYFLSLGIDFESPSRLELPTLPPFETLRGVKYIVLQPRAAGTWAYPHLSVGILQRIISFCPLPVIVTGCPGSDLGLRGIDCSYVGDEINMLRLIQHATLVLAPRSAGAHVAAGYGVPSIIWLPDDQLNWHLDYPAWKVRQIPAISADVDVQIQKALYDMLMLTSSAIPHKYNPLITQSLFWIWSVKKNMSEGIRNLLRVLIRFSPKGVRKLLKKTFIYSLVRKVIPAE